jgi:hypothetical protein
MKKSINKVIAIPSENPAGLDAGLGAHFGHCNLYTLGSDRNIHAAEANRNKLGSD